MAEIREPIKLDFIRGHMGGNLVVLLCGDQIPPGRELELAVKALGPHYLRAHEAGILYPGSGGAALRVKIAEPTSNCFISACGGMTQVLGKALVETALGARFQVNTREPSTAVLLETEAGPVAIEVTVAAGKVIRSITNMDAFIGESYGKGVRAIELRGIPAVQAGKFLVLNADTLRRRYPSADFAYWDGGTLRLLTELQQEFMQLTKENEYNFALYDWRPEHRGHLRIVFPHCIPQDYIEPSCGTGSVAAGIAALAAGELASRGFAPHGRVNLKIESGGGTALGGPDITELFLELRDGIVASASFTHSFVEITAAGQVWLAR